MNRFDMSFGLVIPSVPHPRARLHARGRAQEDALLECHLLEQDLRPHQGKHSIQTEL